MQFIHFASLLAEAYFSLLRGDEGPALSPLQEGLRLGKRKGYFDIYLWRPGLLETVTAKALEKGIETEYVRALIGRNALVPEGGLAATEHWPWPLKLHTLGTFVLLKEGKPLAFSRKVQHKPLLMLKVLVALGGKGVPEDRINDILWPDAEGDLAHKSFATTLHRLRAMLGNEKAIPLQEGHLSLDARHCWTDAFAFESLLERIDEAQTGAGTLPDRARSAEVARRAVSLYRGPFLAGEPAYPWIVAMRERLRSRFLRAVTFLGRFLEENGRWDEAVACYRKGLEVDELAEKFYQRLMSCHHRMGQTAEVMAVYDRCRRTLSSVLGLAPSRETEVLLKTIRPA